MTADSTISIALLLSVVSISVALFNAVGGSKRSRKEEIDAEVQRRAETKEEFVKVNFKLDEFCRRLDEIIKRYDKTSQILADHEKRITKLENEVEDRA